MPALSIRDKTYPLLQSGKSVPEVCQILSCSKSAVLRHARELRIISQERITPRYDWVSVQKAYDSGLCPTECMQRFGFSETAWTRAEHTGKIVTDPARRRKRGKLNEDLTGQRFGKMTVLELAGKTTQWQRLWKCQCDCGNVRTYTTGQLNIGSTQGCGCRRLKGNKSPQWKGHGEIGSAFWGSMKMNATSDKRRDIPFDITIEQAWQLFLKQERRCAISGIELVMMPRKLRTASLDRIDSHGGYTEENVQWVHKEVNTMKWDHTMQEFLDWVNKIYQHQQPKHEHTRQTTDTSTQP